jgi:uncharacterized protein YaaR (DUF327 family)
MVDIGSGGAALINPFLGQILPGGAVRPKKNQKAGGAGKLSFASFLKKDEKTQTAGDVDAFSTENASLDALLDDVYSAGDALKNRPFPDEIQNYKRAVKHFVKFVVDNAFDVETTQSKNRKKEISYTSITIIDQKLEKLAADVMASQGGKLDLLSRVHEINGLLVDLLK